MPAKSKNSVTATAIEKPDLTFREVQVAIGIGDGLHYDEIGQGLTLSVETVRAYVKGLRDKTGLRRKTQLAIWAATHKPWLEKEHRRLQQEQTR